MVIERCAECASNGPVPSGQRRWRRAFSLLELLVVISVVVLLTGLLMPAMHHMRENAHRVICMSHLQQLGQAFHLYVANSHERLPYSVVLHSDQAPQNLMVARRAGPTGDWDGLGLLFLLEYCPAPECFYCPSHHGDHPFERYADQWLHPPPNSVIYTNYHYAGDIEWNYTARRRTLDDGYSLVLATDGLRTASDFNHFSGLNVLRGDGSVRWHNDTRDILGHLPVTELQPVPNYSMIWELVGGTH